MTTSKRWWVLLGLFATSACDDDDAAGKKCQRLVSVMCDARADCALSLDVISQSERSSLVSTCVDSFHDEDWCDGVVGVSDDYDDCLDDIRSDSCFDPDSVPRSCEDVLLVR